ncbi:unnamed protein product [Pylaiella littoralis]
MKCSLLFALALRAQCGNAFVGPIGGLALSNCVSAAVGAQNGIVRRGVASTPQARAAAASSADSEVSVVVRKTAVIEGMAERGDLTKVQAEAALAAFTDLVMSNVADGKKINLQGFGTFEGRARKGRTGRNPRTGEELTIKAKTVPAFSAAKAFKEMRRHPRTKKQGAADGSVVGWK